MSTNSRSGRILASVFVPLAIFSAAYFGCSSSPEDQPQLGQADDALTTTIGVTADSYVRSGAANTNYGTATTILADGSDAGSVLKAFVKFDIGNVGTLTSVKLRLYVANATGGTYNVKATASTWTESGLTWNNAPAEGSTVASFTGATNGTWKEIDLTSISAPNSTVSVAIVSAGSSDGVDFRSKENSSNRPQVVIVSSGSTGTGGSAGTGGAAATGGAPGTGGSTGTGGAAATGGAPGTGGSTGTGGSAEIATTPNLKIAFIGDTGDGSNWTNVMNLIKNEGAQAIVTLGDMTYSANATAWWNATEATMGTTFPIFLTRGNHDVSSWSNFLPKAANHLGGATRTPGPNNAVYTTTYQGLFIAHTVIGQASSTIDGFLANDNHLWKVCAWHELQQKMQVGGKGDEIGWGNYEACRTRGAIIMTAHEHSYERTKTLTNCTNQVVDTTCSSGSSLCVGPGRSYASVVGTGGNSIRVQSRCTPTSSTPPYPSTNTSDPSCPMWAAVYTSNQGATYGVQFLTFNVDGNPKKATGYFKNINGVVIDSFTVFRD